MIEGVFDMLKHLVKFISNFLLGGYMTEFDYRVDLARNRLKKEELDQMVESLYIECGSFRRIKYRSGRIVIVYADSTKDTETVWA